MKKRIGILVLALALVMTAFAGLVTAENGGKATTASGVEFNTEGFPIVDEVITLKGFGGRDPEDVDWEQVYTRAKYEEMTNVDIEWELADVENLAELRGIKLASGDMPDFFYQSRISVVDQQQYGEMGAFLELTDLINQYAPNLKAVMEKEPDAVAMWTMPDGSLYSVSDIVESTNYLALQPQKWWVYMPAINEYNDGKIPTTTDEFYDWMMAAKEANPELTPFSSHRLRWIMNQMKGSFGLGNRSAYTHQYVSLDEETNSVYLNMTSERELEMLKYLNKLYVDGILDPNIFTQEMASYVANGAEFKYYAVHANTPGTFNFTPEEYNDPETGWYAGMTLEGPYGDSINSCYMPNSYQSGQFIITSNCEVPEILIRWIDWFFTEEGTIFVQFGEDGHGFDLDENGFMVNEKKYGKQYDGIQYVSVASYPVNYMTMDITMKQKTSQEMFAEGSPYFEGMQNLYTTKPESVWGEFTFTTEEAAEMAILETDIVNYVLECESNLIAGKMSFDQWDEIQDTLKAMGVERYTEIYNAAYHRIYD